MMPGGNGEGTDLMSDSRCIRREGILLSPECGLMVRTSRPVDTRLSGTQSDSKMYSEGAGHIWRLRRYRVSCRAVPHSSSATPHFISGGATFFSGGGATKFQHRPSGTKPAGLMLKSQNKKTPIDIITHFCLWLMIQSYIAPQDLVYLLRIKTYLLRSDPGEPPKFFRNAVMKFEIFL